MEDSITEKQRLPKAELEELKPCNHGCGKVKPENRECYTCRSNIRRRKMREGPSELDLVKKENDLLEIENAGMEAKILNLREENASLRSEKTKSLSDLARLAQALVDKDALRVERDALREERDKLRDTERAYRILNESVLSKVTSWNSGDFIMPSGHDFNRSFSSLSLASQSEDCSSVGGWNAPSLKS